MRMPSGASRLLSIRSFTISACEVEPYSASSNCPCDKVTRTAVGKGAARSSLPEPEPPLPPLRPIPPPRPPLKLPLPPRPLAANDEPFPPPLSRGGARALCGPPLPPRLSKAFTTARFAFMKLVSEPFPRPRPPPLPPLWPEVDDKPLTSPAPRKAGKFLN